MSDWRNDPKRNCATGNPDLWHPSTSQQETARTELCDGCPVKAQCLAHALTIVDPTPVTGVWGGTSTAQRDGMRGGHVCRDCQTPTGPRRRYCDPCAAKRKGQAGVAKRVHPLGVCDDCGLTRGIKARGLCPRCYTKAQRTGLFAGEVA